MPCAYLRSFVEGPEAREDALCLSKIILVAFWPSFPCILALWAFISLHFGFVGLHFLAFWPCGLSFPCILAFSGSASGPPPQVAKNGPFAQRPYNGFISAVTGSILQFLAFWAFISLHFGLVGFWVFLGVS